MNRPTVLPPAPWTVPTAGLSTYGPPTSLMSWAPDQARTRTMWNRLSRKNPMIAARTAAGSRAATALRNAGSSAMWRTVRNVAALCSSPAMTLRATRPIVLRRVSAAVAPHREDGIAGSVSEIRVRPVG